MAAGFTYIALKIGTLGTRDGVPIGVAMMMRRRGLRQTNVVEEANREYGNFFMHSKHNVEEGTRTPMAGLSRDG